MTISKTHTVHERDARWIERVKSIKTKSVERITNSSARQKYDGHELRVTPARAGAMQFVDYPSRIGGNLVYRADSATAINQKRSGAGRKSFS